ncbi:hypothetical protein Flavo103_06230 [Flavobacterium collinsii]|nr:hypothetical protein Flavo103_06230 [Flavobacterium collinsii]
MNLTNENYESENEDKNYKNLVESEPSDMIKDFTRG